MIYPSERQRAFEESRRRNILEQIRYDSAVLRRIRNEEAEKKARGKVLFCLWFMMDKRLKELEEQRNTHAPVLPDEEWDPAFCEAIQDIPRLRNMCKDLWYAYLIDDKEDELKRKYAERKEVIGLYAGRNNAAYQKASGRMEDRRL